MNLLNVNQEIMQQRWIFLKWFLNSWSRIISLLQDIGDGELFWSSYLFCTIFQLAASWIVVINVAANPKRKWFPIQINYID